MRPIQQQQESVLSFPKEIKFLSQFPFEYQTYLTKKRGYHLSDALNLMDYYDLRFALTGPFRYRIVFPVRNSHGDLITWTGRTVGNGPIRYKALSDDPEKAKAEGLPQALGNIKDCLWNCQDLCNDYYQALIITEGPFDAMRVDYYGWLNSYGHVVHKIRSTCLFGKTLSESQIYGLSSIRHRFKNLYVMLDSNVYTDMTKIAGQLAHLDCKILRLPNGASEPEKLSPQQIKELI